MCHCVRTADLHNCRISLWLLACHIVFTSRLTLGIELLLHKYCIFKMMKRPNPVKSRVKPQVRNQMKHIWMQLISMISSLEERYEILICIYLFRLAAMSKEESTRLLNTLYNNLKWPKDRILIQRVEHVCYCITHGKWPISRPPEEPNFHKSFVMPALSPSLLKTLPKGAGSLPQGGIFIFVSIK